MKVGISSSGMMTLAHAIESTSEEDQGSEEGGGKVSAIQDARTKLMSSVDEKNDSIVIINATGNIMMVNQVCCSSTACKC